MERLDKETEQRVLGALESAIRLTKAGATPDDAIYKVASECGFGAPLVRRMAEAYNVSRTLYHMKVAPAEKRAETFPLADAFKILGRLYPETPKTAAMLAFATAVDRDALPQKETNFAAKKAAAVLPNWPKAPPLARDPSFEVGRWFARRDHLAKAAENARLEFTTAHDKMIDAIEKAALHFRQAGPHEPFALVEKRACWEYGEVVGRALMDVVSHIGNIKEKRAEGPVDRPMIFDVSQEPYASLSTAAKRASAAAEHFSRYASTLDELEKHGESAPMLPAQRNASRMLDDILSQPAEAAGEAPRPFELGVPAGSCLDKEGIDLTSILAGKGFSDALGGLLGSADPDKLKIKAKETIMDPQHETDMASIRVRAMMNDMLANDEVLSSYPQESVAAAYNQLAQLAPTAAQQPAVMRGLLRKMVQQGGVIEPFEAHQLGRIESGLRGNTSVGEQAP